MANDAPNFMVEGQRQKTLRKVNLEMPSDLDLKMHASLYMMLCGSVNEGEALGSEWWHTNF